MSDREEIGRALYLLRAGANPDTFFRTLRAYVLHQIETTEQAVELLRDLAAINPPAFAEASHIVAAQRPLSARRTAEVERIAAEIEANLATVRDANGPAQRAVKPSRKKSARRSLGRR